MKRVFDVLLLLASSVMLCVGCAQPSVSPGKPVPGARTGALVGKANDDVNRAFAALLPVPGALDNINSTVQNATPANLPATKVAVAADVAGTKGAVAVAQGALGKTGAVADLAAASKAAALDAKTEIAQGTEIDKLKKDDPFKDKLLFWALVAFGVAVALIVGSFFVPATLGTLAAQLRTVGIGLGVGGAAFYTLAAFLNLLKWGIVIGGAIALAYYMYRHWSSLFPAKPVTAATATTTVAGTSAKPSLLSALISPFKPVLGGPMTHQG